MTMITQKKVQIRTDEKPITVTAIGLGNYSKEKAEHIKEVVEANAGYMNFEVFVCPYNGSFNVFVQTKYKASKDEIMGQFIGLMVTLI